MPATDFKTHPRGPYIEKDPAAELDYAVDWSAWLGEDQLSAVTWSVPAGLTKTSETIAGGLAVVWLKGGAAGQTYTVSCAVETGYGRKDERSFRVVVVER